MTVPEEGRSPLRVVGLHRLPFDAKRFEEEITQLGTRPKRELTQLRRQFRENWESAWMVVVEFEGAAEALDFNIIGHAGSYMEDVQSGEDVDKRMQSPWLEEVLESCPTLTRAAFYLHHVVPQRPLWYGQHRLSLPPPTTAPPDLVTRIPYTSPD